MNELLLISLLSVFVSTTAVFLAAIVGIPLAIRAGLKKKRPNFFLTAALNTAMGLPPVLVGLVLYLLLFSRGIFGWFNLLFSPAAMVLAQMVLTLPIVYGVTSSAVRELPADFHDTIDALGATSWHRLLLVIQEAEPSILVAVMLALGRAMSEVGAIMIVGGNIRFHTRVLTTAIITEVSQGQYFFSLQLGAILLLMSFALTSVMTYFQLGSHYQR